MKTYAFSLIAVHGGDPVKKRLASRLATSLDPHPQWRKKDMWYSHKNFNHFYPIDFAVDLDLETLTPNTLEQLCTGWGLYAPCNKPFVALIKKWKLGGEEQAWAKKFEVSVADIHKLREFIHFRLHATYDLRSRNDLNIQAQELGLTHEIK